MQENTHPATISHPSSRWFLAALLANLALLAALTWHNLLALGDAWQRDEYSHGALIPFLALLIGWNRLTAKTPDIRPDWLGFGAIILGIAAITISRLSAFEPPAHYGFLLGLFGLSLAYGGRKLTLALLPALVYLAFAIPLPRLIHVGLSGEMQLVSSTLGVWVLQLLGIPVYQEGNIIDLGEYKLQVVEACNGLRYLFPLMSFSFLMALLYDDKMWKRIALFLAAIPITIGMNSLRIAMIGITVNQWGIEMAEGLIHEMEGWVVFVLCLATLFLLMRILIACRRKGTKAGVFRVDFLIPARAPLLDKSSSLRLRAPAIATLLVTLAGAIALTTWNPDNRNEIIPPHPPFATFPLQLGEWQGQMDTIPADILDTLKASDYTIANYTRPQNADTTPVNFYMAYYNSQRIGTSIHSPANCIPGGGWRIENRRTAPVATGTQTIPVSRMVIRNGDNALLVYYWFDGRDRILRDQYEAKWYLLVDSITKHRTDGALVRLTTPILKFETEQQAESRLNNFLQHAYPEIRNFVP